MMGALQAETLKLVRHRAIWGLVWIFPIGLTLIYLLGIALGLGRHGAMPGLAEPPGAWIANSTMVWKAAQSGPARYLIAAFAALAFGGEYGWNTWKLIVPYSRRWVLIGAKYAVVLGLLLVALILAAVLTLVFGALVSFTGGEPLPAGITPGDLIAAHARAALATVVSTLLTVGYGSLAAILLRSTMGGAIVGIAAVTVEGVAGAVAPILNPMIFMALPTHHLHNLTAFILTGGGAPLMLRSGVVQEGWATSLAWIGGWIALLIGATVAIFERQDLN
jgi:ABC-type transport system involved in multi-copper enzyme maturation permease subunit